MDENDAIIPKVPIRPFRCLSEASQMISGSYWLFVGLSAVAFLLAALTPMGILMGSMMCGLSLCYFRQMRREEVSFDVLFKGFDYFVESLIATLIIMGVVMAMFIPLYIVFGVLFLAMGLFPRPGIGNQQPFGGGAETLAFLGMIGMIYALLLVVLLIVSVLTAFVYPLIVDRKLKAIPALKLSVKAVLTNFWGMLGLTLLNGLLCGLAMLCCYVPMFLVLPFTYGANIVAYRRVFPDSAEGVD